ncbi:MAG TPA: septal ring lytic transglycosylase RlpA family protein [Solirubrobacteraceae bacterium]|nr:septal ring lytic transglycosylase RlpA family protein [Solirubrobacteraceae bacterium]
MHARLNGRPLTRALLVLACALALPSAAAAASGSGGGGLGGGGSTGSGSGSGASGSAPPTAAPVPTAPASVPVTVSDGGITLRTRSAALLRHRLTFSGSAPGAAGQTIEIEREARATHGQWAPTVSATVAADGSFRAVWHTSQVGRFAVRAVRLSSSSSARATAMAASAPGSPLVSVYRGARATIYGPGFYGRRTACGARLTRSTLGVANRTLRCGTEVSLMFGGREITVPVIDRGPYANGASWDVTMATARALGMDGTDWIGAIALPGRAASAAWLSSPALP